MPAVGKGLLGPTPKALKPLSKKQILRQATRLSKAVYRPALRQLKGEEKSAKNLYEKRRSDNEFYRDWLETKANELAASANASDERLLAAGTEVQGQSDASMQALQASLVAQAPGAVGDRTLVAQQTLTPALQQRQDLLEAARSQSLQQVSTHQTQVQGRQAELLAQQTATEAKNQADLYDAMKTIAGSKQQVRLERAARAQEEVARMLEQEIAKGQAQVEMRNAAGQLAIALKGQKAGVRQFAKGQKLDRAEHREDKRSSRADEAQAERDSRRDARGDRGAGGEQRRDVKNAQSAAQTIGRALGRDKAKKKFAAYVKEIKEQSGVDHALAAKMARKWLRRSRKAGERNDSQSPGNGSTA